MIQQAVAKLVERQSLSFEEARDAVTEILAGQVPASQISAFLVGLRMKGETIDEIAGCAEAMRRAATRVLLPAATVVVDTCGTGGDKQGSFNISTAAAFVVAGAGFVVAKHGNRSISSQCGSADVLEALGVKVDPPVPVVERCLMEIGIGFLFAPAFHPAMRFAMPVRRELGVRTVFNILGPLCNPAGANAQIIGVYDPRLVDVVARVLVRLGTQNSMVLHGQGHDEITLSGPTLVAEVVKGRVRKRRLTPKDFGFKTVSDPQLRGGTKEENADLIRRLLEGETGPRRDAVVANAAAAIFVAAQASGRREIRNLKVARQAAEQAIDSGAARQKLDQLARMSQAAP